MITKDNAALLVAALNTISSIAEIVRDVQDGRYAKTDPETLKELQRKWDKTRERFEGVAKSFFDITKVS